MGPYFKPLKARILRAKTIDRSLTYQVVINISWINKNFQVRKEFNPHVTVLVHWHRSHFSPLVRHCFDKYEKKNVR